MNSKLSQILCIIFLFVASRVEAGFWGHLERGPGLKIRPPHVRVETLENGMRCYLLPDRALPMVKISVITRVGNIYDPQKKVGLAQLTGMLMRSGGTRSHSPDEFDAVVDNLGATLTSGINAEMGEAQLTVLSDDLEEGLRLLFEMLIQPRFDPGRMKIARLKIEEGLLREDDDPRALASREFRQFVYDPASPWARRPTVRTLKNISLDDIRSVHQNYFRADNMLLAAAGDFDPDRLVTILKDLTRVAPRGEVVFPDVPQVRLEFEPGFKEVARPFTQSFIRLGHLGIKRHNPDRFALTIMNDILGADNFKSRLMEDVRVRRGLAYSIKSDVTAGTDFGLFVVAVNTKAQQTGDVIEIITGHVGELAGTGKVQAEELEFAKHSVLSQLVFEFDSAFKVADRRAKFYFYGYPDNYWQVFRDKIALVSARDVKNVARKYLHPEGLKVVIVGPKSTDHRPETRD